MSTGSTIDNSDSFISDQPVISGDLNINDLLEHADDLSPDQQALLMSWLSEQLTETPDTDAELFALAAVPRSAGLPLSFAQQRLWLVSQLSTENHLYNLPFGIRITGVLNQPALQRSLDMIVERHEALRTTFEVQDGQPLQYINQPDSLALHFEDLSSRDAVERDRIAMQLVEQTARHAFDLTADLLLRATLLRLDVEEHLLVVVMHHIASDGWSRGVFYRELIQLYQSYTAGQQPALPHLPIQYPDFAQWQRQSLQGSLLEEQLAYWRRQLADAPAVLDVPADRPRPSQQSYRGGELRFELPTDLTSAIYALCEREQVTLFMLLLAAFQAVLNRYTGQSDLMIGAPISGRTRAEVEDLIGFFVNTLVLRADLSGNPTFRVLLQQARQVALDAYTYQSLPFEKLVEELQPERSLSYHPLFQVMLIVQNAPLQPRQVANVQLTPLLFSTGTSQLDIALYVEETRDGLTGLFEYSTDLFDPATIDRLSDHLRLLLQMVVANPDLRLSDLSLSTELEQRQQLVDWNATARPYPHMACTHQLFEEQVSRNSEAIAVVFGEDSLTYGELNQRANQLAHYLRAQGVGPDVRVSVCLERSADLVVALLAVLKAGGAYVPLDPSYPEQRLQLILEDAGVAVMLTQQQLRPESTRMLPQLNVPVVCLDADRAAIERASALPLPNSVTPRNLAYIIYTSGSTGRPKGVQIEHGTLTNFLCSMQQQPGFTDRDSLLAVTTVSFDIAGLELYLPLISGGQVILLDHETAADGTGLRDKLSELQPSVMQATPATWRMLIDAGWSGSPGLRALCGGEALPRDLANQISDRVGALWNLYGPTETTIWSTIGLVERGDGLIALGHPIANTQVYILDPHGRLALIGVWGELYIGGDGLARGYLNRPDLTAERFVPDPFASRPGSRLYRTGDLVRYRADGTIEFMGRVDQQVKLRGYRIELGEIEAVLRQHPLVRETVVIVREDTPPAGGQPNQRLVAYVVPSEAEQLASHELRAHLANHLPEFMVPSIFAILDRLPLTPNGKLDRKALPAPDPSESQRGITFVAPRTAVEQQVAAIWGTVLGLEQVSIDDNFFVLGGHSLLATQVMARIRATCDVELPMRSLFEAPTVADLAQRIEQAQMQVYAPLAKSIQPVPHDRPLPLSFAQQRLWFLYQLQPDSPAYNIPSAFRLHGALDLAALQDSLSAIVQRHAILRTTFVTIDAHPFQVIAPTLAVPLPIVMLEDMPEHMREAELQRLMIEEAQRPFDLSGGPLLRTMVIQLAPDDAVLLLNLHHIIADAWSFELLFQELSTLYAAARQHQPALLPPLALQYADFAVWQRQWLQGAVLDQQINYWRQQLADAPPVLDMPTDFPRPSIQTFQGAAEFFHCPPVLAQAVQHFSQQTGVTPFMTLLSAWQALLSRYSGQDDIVVGSPIANRTRAEVEPLIGFFVNTLVLRARLAGLPNFRALVEQVREVCLGAYAHQDLPFEMLVEQLQPERDLSRSALFQIMFVMQHASTTDLNLAGLEAQSLPLETAMAKFDLTMSIWEEADGFMGRIGYNIDLFAAPTITRLAKHFVTFLSAAIVAPEQALNTLPLLTELERQQLLATWNTVPVDYPRNTCLHDLFAAQVARTPEAPALMYEGVTLSYQELDRRTDDLARYLQQLGVGPDTVVPLCCERSLEMVIGILGILKAGGAYLPLDPSTPSQRLAFMVEQVQPPVVLTLRHLRAAMPQPMPQVVYLDTDWPVISQGSTLPARGSTMPHHLAYVIYTSGSTGQPKGVAIEHRQIVNYVQSILDRLALPAGSSFAMVSTFAADLGHTVLFPALCSGGCLHIIGQERASDGYALMKYFQQHPVDCLKIVPSHFAAMLQAVPNPEHLMPRRRLVLGGEASRREWIREVQPLAPECRIFNHYGPTETTVGVLTYQAEPQHLTAAKGSPTIPLGYALPNVHCYVLDTQLQPAPVGVPGELYIGGMQLARGYLQRPDLTAERFAPNPFGAPGSRLYRTGDLVRYRADGTIEFLGRIDQQVKVRGFRIELREIEAALSQYPAVADVVVLAREDISGDRRLVAYVVPQENQERVLCPEGTRQTKSQNLEADSFQFSVLGSTNLRAYLKQRLPDYMVPAAFVVLPALPLTANGKLDRRALPVPDIDGTEDQVFTAPSTPVELLLAGIWQDVLNLERVDIHRSFFELGGHSLLAIRVMARIRETFQIELSLHQLFEAATIAQFAALIEQVQRDQAGLKLPPLESRPRHGHLPLSFAQQRLWFLQQMEPESSSYNVPMLLRLNGALNLAVLADSLTHLLQRHEVLQASFVLSQDEPAQIIHPVKPIRLSPAVVQGATAEERETKARQLVDLAAQAPFDLTSDPPLRSSLYQLGPEEYWLLLTLHHIVSDGRSVAILFEELTRLYTAGVAGRPALLEPLPVQYADFACWQREWLRGEMLDRLLSYWVRQLQGVPQQLQLPTDYPRPHIQRFQGKTQKLHIPAEITHMLRVLSRQEQATLFMTLLAAFNGLLFRYTGQTDLVVGSPISGRNQTTLERLIGFFVNTLVFRTDLSDRPSFRTLVRRVRQTALEAYAHQDLPFERLVEEVSPQRSLSYSPLIQVLFVLQQSEESTCDTDELQWDMQYVSTGTAKFDLTLALEETSTGLHGVVEYDSDLFAPATITRLIGHFSMLLHSIVDAPDTPIDRLRLLTAAECHQQLVDWNPGSTDRSPAVTLLDRFEAQAARVPEAIAVVYGDTRLTYAELEQQSNQLGHALRALGVGPDTLVPICVERSLEMIVGILGILKAGGAYVPLDPSYPQERLAFMLADTQATVVVLQSHLADRLPAHAATPIYIDQDRASIAEQPYVAVPRRLHPGNLAYIIYTSGSTGTPKGVQVTHGNVARLLSATNDWFHFDEHDVWTLFHSFAFDFSVWELWGALAYGGRLVVVPYWVSRAPDEFYSLVQRERVTVLNQTPSAFRQFIQADAAQVTSDLALRLVIFGGEALELHALRPWFERHGDRRPQLVNMYGITETTVHVTYRPLALRDLEAGSGSMIGGQIPDLQMYILDPAHQPLPIGVPGELYVGGAGLARGYRHRADLTATRFIPHPFSGLPGNPPGERLYRTGDLARYLANGDVEYLGRIDQQVKVRGFRIELGEIEAVLGQHPGVAEAIVLAQGETLGDKRLVAYVVPTKDQEQAAGDDEHSSFVPEVRNFLKDRLPDYMVPAAFVVLPALPLTANGKVDRRALPAPHSQDYSLNTEADSPRTLEEAQLAQIWQEVLGLDVVERRAHFFELGGHSLLATQVIVRIRKSFGLDLPLRALFESPTLAGLAARVAAAQRQQQVDSAPPIRPIDRKEPLPLSFAQQRLWLLEQFLVNKTAYHIDTCLHIRGSLDVAALEQAFNAVIARHETLRTTFGSAAGEPVQVIAPHTAWTLPLFDLRGQSAVERAAFMEQVIEREVRQPFDLRRDSLIRATLLRLDDTDYRLVLVLHHIITDGWSTNVLFRDLSSAYAAYTAGQSLSWEPLPIQYADYAAWQRQWLAPEAAGGALERQLAYWRQQLANAPALLALPTDRPRPAVQSLKGTIYRTIFPATLTQQLQRLSQREGVTLFMTLLAAWKTLLSRYAGQSDIIVGSPIAGRTRLEVEEMIGFFVNVLVLRTDLSGDISFRELLGRVRTVLLDAHMHQDIPFEKLVEELAPERNLSYTPLFQVVFDLQLGDEDLSLPGLDVHTVEIDTGTVKQDLALVMTDTGAGLEARVRYSTDLFDESTIERMMGQLQILLERVVANPEEQLERLPLLSQDEYHQLVAAWNATTVEYPRDYSLHEYIEEHAAQRPSAIAVVFEDQQLTYGELNRRANQLARLLRGRGVGPDTLVALCVERSLEMIVGLLGVLKAGGAYVPLDPSHPSARLSLMLQDLQAPVMLTQHHVVAKLPPHSGTQICIDTDWSMIGREDDGNLPTTVTGDNLAYIIYTSGSTGTPKGVLVSHRGLGNIILSQRRWFSQTTESRVLQFAALTFDASIFEVMMALGAGARLYLTPPHAALPGQGLIRLLEEQQITTVTLTPTTLAALAEPALPALTTVTVAGEACPPELVARWSRDRHFFNLYGPTEATIWATAAACVQSMTSPPIGRPITNTQVYVLDRHLQPVPTGVPGELHISGVGIARGYLNRPDLTAERFIPNPFVTLDDHRTAVDAAEAPVTSQEPPAAIDRRPSCDRLYKTGDLVRWLPDGTLEFLGRVDQQVKIRGFRIELGEIERALASHSAIQDLIVVDDGAGQSKRLVAYIVPKAGSSVQSSDLRQYLKERIPEYMIPAAYVLLDVLPLNSSGKVDRRALPAPRQGTSEQRSYVAPRNALEQIIAGLWQEYLHLDQVGVDDNFFELGGHSLLIVQMYDRLRQVLQRDFAIVDLFHYSTISALAGYLSETGPTTAANAARDERADKLNEGKNRLKQLQRKQRPAK